MGERKIFWLSFCDPRKPQGQQFLGACVIEVTAEEAAAAKAYIDVRFPQHEDDAEWLSAAMRKAWAAGCNPGGEVASFEVPIDNPNLNHYQRGVLMDRSTIEAIDRRIEIQQNTAS